MMLIITQKQESSWGETYNFINSDQVAYFRLASTHQNELYMFDAVFAFSENLKPDIVTESELNTKQSEWPFSSHFVSLFASKDRDECERVADFVRIGIAAGESTGDVNTLEYGNKH